MSIYIYIYIYIYKLLFLFLITQNERRILGFLMRGLKDVLYKTRLDDSSLQQAVSS
jgi:hypothetical protein